MGEIYLMGFFSACAHDPYKACSCVHYKSWFGWLRDNSVAV